MNKCLILIFCFLLSFGGVAGEISPIKKGDPSPIDGYVITKEFEKKARQTNEENKLLKQKEITLKDLQVVNEQRIEFYKENAKQAHKRLQKEKFKSFWKTTFMFIGGIAVGAGVFYMASKVYK